MLDGPKIGLIVLVVALVLVGLGIYLHERKHWGRGRRWNREPQRLPLFGTDQLYIRTVDGRDGDAADDTPLPSRPAPRTTIAETPRTATPRPGQGHGGIASSNGTAAAAYGDHARDAAPAFSRPEPTLPAAPLATPRRVAPAVADRPSPAMPPARPIVAGPVAPVTPVAPPTPDLALIDGETLRFIVPSDATVEFLPGWLEIVAGPEAGREVRFARSAGESVVEVTFGRSEGPANRHVQILARTVSRRHAVMSLIDEHWQLTNLSSTNPVVLNGRVLAGNEVAPLLVEGDRIEMGEVVFVFHDG